LTIATSVFIVHPMYRGKYIFGFLCFCAVCVILLSGALVSASPISPVLFNGPAPGARSHSLGNAGIALFADPFSSFYNPAALCYIYASFLLLDFHYEGTPENDTPFNLPRFFGMTPVYFSAINHAGGITWHPCFRRTDEEVRRFFSSEYGETLFVNTVHEYRGDEFFFTMTTLSTETLENPFNTPLFGINIKYYLTQLAESEVTRTRTAPVDATSNIDTGNGFGLDIGFAYAGESFVVGIAIKDIFSRVWWSDYDTDVIPVKAGAGISLLLSERFIFSTDMRYDNWYKRTGIYSGVEVNFLSSKTPKTKHIPVGEPKQKNYAKQGSIIRLGTKLDDVKQLSDIIYTFGYGYTFSRLAVEIALMGDSEFIKNKCFSSQISFLVLY